MFIDTHCHLDLEDFDTDRDTVIDRARESGVDCIVNIGISLESSRRSVELSRKYEFVYASVGIHPHDSDKVNPEAIDSLKELASDKKVIAVGETGLDYYRDLSPRDKQKQTFIRFINLAKELDLPLVIHDRDAHADVLNILSDNTAAPVKGVMHCFSGDSEFVKQCLDLGLYISFTGNLTFSSASKLRETAKAVPLERLLLETDAPYLAPQKLRGKRNEPAYIRFLAEELAGIHDTSVEKIAGVTSTNAKKLFKIGKNDDL